jgi:hypothetical protein
LGNAKGRTFAKLLEPRFFRQRRRRVEKREQAKQIVNAFRNRRAGHAPPVLPRKQRRHLRARGGGRFNFLRLV